MTAVAVIKSRLMSSACQSGSREAEWHTFDTRGIVRGKRVTAHACGIFGIIANAGPTRVRQDGRVYSNDVRP